jgi:predicted metal-dependent phosphoesterase TrpH
MGALKRKASVVYCREAEEKLGVACVSGVCVDTSLIQKAIHRCIETYVISGIRQGRCSLYL